MNVAIHYIATWLSGNGAVALYNLMEDAATAEISRTQIWQWLKNEVRLDDGSIFNPELYQALLHDELTIIEKQVGKVLFEQQAYQNAILLFKELVENKEFEEFLTTKAYAYL